MKRRRALVPMTDRLAALSEAVRLRVCRLLEEHELSVGEIARVVQLPQSTVSRHLKVLTDAGFLTRRAEGTATLYRLTADDLDPAVRALWAAVGEQIARDGTVVDDLRRLKSVLAERTTDSVSFFGRIAGEWDAVRRELFGSHFTATGLLAMLPAEWTVADLGCGTGNASEVLAPYVREVIALDQSAAMLDAARKRLEGVHNVRFVDGPIEAMPLPDACADAAVCIMVLHHIADPAEAFAEMHRIIRPGGAALVIDLFEHDREEYRRLMGHKHLGFSADRMKGYFESAGFSNARVLPLAADHDAKGPGMLVATGWKRKRNG